MSDLTELRHKVEREIKYQKKKAKRWYRRKGIKDRINEGLTNRIDELEDSLYLAAGEIIDLVMTTIFFEVGEHLTQEDKDKIRERLEGLRGKISDHLLAFLYHLINRIW